mmetsp:Transcript_14698/g.26303  ORF Transcript_14698/g.26303 Transcript_14698/m.26303 type:complete len:107 (+) Transcript_14698:100-420(+)
MIMIMTMLMRFAYVCSSASLVTAFGSTSISHATARLRFRKVARKNAYSSHSPGHSPLSRLKSNSDDADGDNTPASEAIGGELVTALARLDEKWELARGDGGKKKNR